MREEVTLTGQCTCGQVRYAMQAPSLFVHCCHCTWCQRETGSAFAVNAMIEASRVTLLAGEPETIDTPSASGKGQLVTRCPTCKVAVWSNYGGNQLTRFVRVGTLDDPSAQPPDIHIFTSTKQPWVLLPTDVPVMEEFYDRKACWPVDSLERLDILRGKR